VLAAGAVWFSWAGGGVLTWFGSAAAQGLVTGDRSGLLWMVATDACWRGIESTDVDGFVWSEKSMSSSIVSTADISVLSWVQSG
jgi:hypothetical protein